MTDWIRLALTHCLLCGGFPVVRRSELCGFCWQRVEGWFSEPRIGIDFDTPNCLFGFTWVPGGPQAKVSLTYGLKGQARQETWNELARLFFHAHHREIKKSRYLLIPIPGRERNSKDHAWRWARALAPWVGGHVVSPLIRTDQRSQKSLRRKERQGIQLEISLEHRLWLKKKVAEGWKIALVDDVVTTGATVRAATSALVGLPSSDVWTLAYRSKAMPN